MSKFLIILVTLTCQVLAMEGGHDVKIGDFSKNYPVIPAHADSSVGIVFLDDVSDNWDMLAAAAPIISKAIQESPIFADLQVIVLPGDGATMLATLLVSDLKKVKPSLDVCLIRGTAKGGSVKSVAFQSITSTTKKSLHLRPKQLERIEEKNVIIFDDVLSSGATFNAVTYLAKESGCKILGYACMATEGADVTSFNDLPLFKATHLPVVKL